MLNYQRVSQTLTTWLLFGGFEHVFQHVSTILGDILGMVFAPKIPEVSYGENHRALSGWLETTEQFPMSAAPHGDSLKSRLMPGVVFFDNSTAHMITLYACVYVCIYIYICIYIYHLL